MSIDDLAESSWAISSQQASLGRWARHALPDTALIGVNDTGAIAYFSGRRTFDVVGLTTRGEARYWAAGAGSRFEHYEKLPPSARPTHFIVYPEWFALDELLGEGLTSRSVRHSILGGVTMAAHVASYASLGTGAEPAPRDELRGRSLLDELDVADLESEAAHAYHLFDAYAAENRLTAVDGRADGGRASRTRDEFMLDVAPGGVLVVRCGASSPGRLVATIDDVTLPGEDVEPTSWTELALAIPASVEQGLRRVKLEGVGTTFESLHYWSYE
jgi:hypothetical protein